MEAGGAQRVALLLAEEFRKRGYNEELWFFYIKRPFLIDRPNIFCFYPQKVPFLIYGLLFCRLLIKIYKEKPQVVITHTHYANILGQFAAAISRVPKRLAVQHNPVYTYPKMAKFVDKIMGTFGIYSDIICVSKTVIQSMESYSPTYKSRAKVIYNGLPKITVSTSREQIRRKWHLPVNSYIIINAGRLSRQKNQGVLIKALEILPSDIKLVIIGAGELEEKLKRMVSQLSLHKRVFFIGEISWYDAMDLISASDLFVFPSIYESMGLAMIEAMQLGLPVVAADIPALREVAGNAALYVNPDNHAVIAQSIVKIKNSHKLAKTMSGRSIEKAAKFSLKIMVDSYEKLFY